MATTTERPDLKTKSWNVDEVQSLPSSASTPRRRGKRGLIVLAAAAAGVCLLVFLAGPQSFSSLVGAPEDDNAITHQVTRGDLLLTITEDGELASASNMDVKCEVAGGSTILWIVADGKQVTKGEEIVRLDSSTLTDELNAQRIVYEKARATKIQAEETYAAAKLAVQEYVEGTYLQELQTLDANITIALENLRSAENALLHTKRMARKAYVTTLQLEAQEFAVERAKLELESAKSARRVLTAFTKEKMTRELESARDAAEAAMRAETAAFNLEEDRLKRLEAQLEKCIIHAPQDGMVVYANENSRRRSNENTAIEEGTAVRDQQVLIRLPDLTQMQAKVAVHESKVESLSTGMRAHVRIQDRQVEGSITTVATQPEPTGWFSPNLKEYAAIVKIDGQPEGLKPGMTAEVTIQVDHLRDVLTVPVQCVVEQNRQFYCWVQTASGPERRPVVLGVSNNKVIEIKDGVIEGDNVVLNPRALVPEAREEGPANVDEKENEEQDVPALTAPEGPLTQTPAEATEQTTKQAKSDSDAPSKSSAEDTAGGS